MSRKFVNPIQAQELIAHLDAVAYLLNECYEDLPRNVQGSIQTLGHEMSAFRKRLMDELPWIPKGKMKWRA